MTCLNKIKEKDKNKMSQSKIKLSKTELGEDIEQKKYR